MDTDHSMKPNFALNLSHDGIALYHRGKSGWSTVGTVALDDADVGASLEMLRKTAVTLESGGMTTKILIPDSQILFTVLEVPPAGPNARAALIRAQLEGRTPYAVEDLKFDWRPLDGNRVALAVVARETLAEAEAFATEHRFNPVSFAAAPDPALFDGEPYFGPAPSAQAILIETGPIEPDREVIDLAALRALGGTQMQTAQAPVSRDDGPGPEVADSSVSTAPDAEPDHPGEVPPAPPDTAPEQLDAATAAHAPVPDMADADPEARSAPEALEMQPVDMGTDHDQQPEPALASGTGDAAEDTAEVEAPFADLTLGEDATDPLLGDDEDGPSDAKKAAKTDANPEASIDSGEAPAAADPVVAVPSFASRRAGNGQTAGPARPADAARAAPELDDPLVKLSRRHDKESPGSEVRNPSPRLVGGRTVAAGAAPRIGSALSVMPDATRRPATVARTDSPVELRPVEFAIEPETLTTASPDPEGTSVLRRLTPVPPRLKPLPSAPTRRAPVINFGPKRAAKEAAKASSISLPTDDPIPDMPSQATAAQSLSVFGAQKPATQRSPLLAVLLTLALLAVLAGLALWSTFWSDPPPPQAAADPAQDQIALADGAVPTPAPPILTTPPVEAPVPEATAPAPAPLPEVAPEPAAGLDAAAPPEAAPIPQAAEPVLPDDPAAGTGLAVLPQSQDTPDQGTDFAALPGDSNSGAGLDDTGTAVPVAPGTEMAAPEVALVPDDTSVPTVADEALADGEPDAALPAETAGPADELALDAPAVAAPLLPSDPVTELVPTGKGAAERVAAQLLEELTPEVAERRYASTGVWVLPPVPPAEPGFDSVDDLYVAAIDSEIPGEDAVELPPLRSDSVLPSPPPPPAFGTRFDFDERGLVRATPEGALTPDGVRIYLGKPPVTPKLRPGEAVGATPAPVPTDKAAPPAANGTVDDSGLPRAPGVPDVRPKPRPNDLTQQNEKAMLGGHTRVELASLRPRQRPAVIAALYEAAATPDAPPEVQAALELAPATDLAVQVSRLPKARPEDFSKMVAAAQVQPKVVAAPAPQPVEKNGSTDVAEADGEPTLVAAAVMPKLPTKATVAKSATVANVLNLSKINLIGVYGSQSQRRALVRLSNGKFVKVKIGDRIDGGKVAAIGEAELIYVKSGRQVRLQMPNKA